MSNIDILAYARRGKLFTAVNVSAKISTIVGTVITGLILSNPKGSGKYLSFLTLGYTMTTALGSIASLGIAISPVQPIIPTSLSTTTVAVKSATGGAGNSVADVYDEATLGVACVVARWFAGDAWITGGTGIFPYSFVDKIDGELGIMPGASAAVIGLGSTIATGMSSLSFVEIDL